MTYSVVIIENMTFICLFKQLKRVKKKSWKEGLKIFKFRKIKAYFVYENFIAWLLPTKLCDPSNLH